MKRQIVQRQATGDGICGNGVCFSGGASQGRQLPAACRQTKRSPLAGTQCCRQCRNLLDCIASCEAYGMWGFEKAPAALCYRLLFGRKCRRAMSSRRTTEVDLRQVAGIAERSRHDFEDELHLQSVPNSWIERHKCNTLLSPVSMTS